MHPILFFFADHTRNVQHFLTRDGRRGCSAIRLARVNKRSKVSTVEFTEQKIEGEREKEREHQSNFPISNVRFETKWKRSVFRIRSGRDSIKDEEFQLLLAIFHSSLASQLPCSILD